MVETKLEYAVNELINNINPKEMQFHLEKVGELLLNLSYFKTFMETNPNLGPLIYINLLKQLSFKKYKPKTIIWDYNDKVDGVYIIISGEVKIYKQPDKSSLIRCKNTQKRLISPEYKTKIINKLNRASIFEKFVNTNKSPLFKLLAQNLLQKRETLFNSNIFKSKKAILMKKNENKKLRKYKTATFTSNYNLSINKHNNISPNDQKITLTDKNYIFREPQDLRRLDYVETFGKMIGEDAMLQELAFRNYACETSNNCILAFLNAKNYHLLFDKINSTKKGNIILFLYKLNYFNNKNDFIHKLSRIIKFKSYKKDTYIYKQDTPLLNLYIIRNGTVSINIVKTSKYKSELNQDLIINSQRILRECNSLNDSSKINNNKNFEHFTKERSFELDGEYQEKKLYTLIKYGKGELLGNLEYYLKWKKYFFSVKCMTDVELYEIDLKIFNKILKPYNIEYFEQKTRNQLNFFSGRIKEINFVNVKNDEDQFTSRNKYMKLFFQRHPLSSLRINKKYINDGKNVCPIDAKYKNKKLKNTKISPFCLYELASVLNNGRNQVLKNPFITNNPDFTKIFDGESSKKKSLFNFYRQVNNKKTLININKISNLQRNKKLDTSNKGKNYSCNNILPKNKPFDNNKIWKSNSLNSYLNLYQIENKYKKLEYKRISAIDKGNNYIGSRNTVRLSFNNLNLKFNQNKNKSAKFLTTFINIYQKVQKENMEKQEQKLKEKRNKTEKKREISSAIAFKGYRVYLQKNERTKIRLKKHIIPNLEK